MASYLFFKNLAFLFDPQSAPSGGIILVMPIVMMVLIILCLGVLPQWRRRQSQMEHSRFLESLRLGDRVVTSAGLHGTVVALRGAAIRLEIAPDVTLIVARMSIAGRAAESD